MIVDEQPGIVIEYLSGITATDAWHAASGFCGSQKGATAFEHHKTKGPDEPLLPASVERIRQADRLTAVGFFVSTSEGI